MGILQGRHQSVVTETSDTVRKEMPSPLEYAHTSGRPKYADRIATDADYRQVQRSEVIGSVSEEGLVGGKETKCKNGTCMPQTT